MCASEGNQTGAAIAELGGFDVEVIRGGVLDCAHRVVAAAVDAEGNVIGEARPSDADRVVFMRSAAKPFQAACAIAAGVPDRLGLADEHIAVACGSHNHSPLHLRLVNEILEAAGLTPADLQAGDDGSGGPFFHQCSGNHALALAWCVVEGWPTDTYLDAAHPAQVAYLAAIEQATGCAPITAPDGCGMTAYGYPLRDFARAFGRLGAGWDGLDGLPQAAAAMRAYPNVVRWPGEIDTELMVADPSLVAKVAAEAGIGVGSTDGRGLALRIVDGNPRAYGPATVAAVRAWLAPELGGPAIDKLSRPPLLNGVGRQVGHLAVSGTASA